jgi:hypothetical protein
MAAKAAFPDRKSFVIRIGHEAAFHIGSILDLPRDEVIAAVRGPG